MIDSMPWHARSWVTFAARHGTEARRERHPRAHHGPHRHRVHARAVRARAVRCRMPGDGAREGRDLSRACSTRNFAEVAGFTAFAKAGVARKGLKIAVGTAGDKPQHRVCDVAPENGPAAAGNSRWRRRPDRQADAGNLSRSSPPHRRRARALHRVRRRALRHRSRPSWRHARRGRVQHAQRRRTWPARTSLRPCATINELTQTNFLETLDDAIA
jgi:hypothetical protein